MIQISSPRPLTTYLYWCLRAHGVHVVETWAEYWFQLDPCHTSFTICSVIDRTNLAPSQQRSAQWLYYNRPTVCRQPTGYRLTLTSSSSSLCGDIRWTRVYTSPTRRSVRGKIDLCQAEREEVRGRKGGGGGGIYKNYLYRKYSTIGKTYPGKQEKLMARNRSVRDIRNRSLAAFHYIYLLFKVF